MAAEINWALLGILERTQIGFTPDLIRENKEIVFIKYRILKQMGFFNVITEDVERKAIEENSGNRWSSVESMVTGKEDNMRQQMKWAHGNLSQLEREITEREKNPEYINFLPGQNLTELINLLPRYKSELSMYAGYVNIYDYHLDSAIKKSGLLTDNEQRVEPLKYQFNEVIIWKAPPNYDLPKGCNETIRGREILLKKSQKLEQIGAVQKLTLKKGEEPSYRSLMHMVKTGEEQLERRVIQGADRTEQARRAAMARQAVDDDIRLNDNAPPGGVPGHQLIELIIAFETIKSVLEKDIAVRDEYLEFEAKLLEGSRRKPSSPAGPAYKP